MRRIQAFVVLMSVTAFSVTANYICACNRGLGLQQYPVFDSMQTGIGYLYPNVCAPLTATIAAKGWIAINYQQQNGYVQKSIDIALEMCAGARNPVSATTSVTTSATAIAITTPTPTGNIPHPQTLGNVKLCPEYVIMGAKAHGYLLTQHGQSCYEVCQEKVSWTHARSLCSQRGGHLVSVQTDYENTYLHNLLQHAFYDRVWIGLHDRHTEEQFEWTTGEKVAYTHWKPRYRMSANHTHEDCVQMLPNSYWDDVYCGATHPVNEAAQNTAAYVCEYKSHTKGSFLIG